MTASSGNATAYRGCPICEASCGLEITVSGGKVQRIRGHAGDVFSGGYVCPKGAALKDLHEDPDRLRTPLVRRDGRLVETTWDDAFAEINRRLTPILAQHGRDAVAMLIGNPTVHKMSTLLYFPRLIRALGSRNVFSASTLDQMPKQLSAGLMFGHWISIPVPDIERSQFLLILGANPAVSNGSLWTVPDFRGKARALQARGGKIVVVDPRRNETAKLADKHLFIRPGGDAFFLAGMVHTLFAEGLVRLGRLAEHITGVEALRDAVTPFAPEAVAERCGIPAATVRELARTLAATERAAVYGRLGTCTQSFGTVTSWLIDVLNVLTGHLDEPGGAMFPKAPAFAHNTMGKPGVGKGIATGRYHSRVSRAPEVFGELPMGCLAEEIETPGSGQVKAAIAVASNPVLSAPNGPRVAAALEQLEFLVCVDIYLNETTRHADVVLPGLSPLEESHYDVAFPQLSYRNYARANPAVFAPPAGHLPEWHTLLRMIGIVQGKGPNADVTEIDDTLLREDLVRNAGPMADAIFRALAPRKGPERLLDLGLRSGPYGDGFGAKPEGLTLTKVLAAPGGIDLGPLAPRIPEVLRTPSGKVELAPASCLADLQRAAGDLRRTAPSLVIVGRRQVRSNNSWLHNLPSLAKGPFDCTALVHPADAMRLGLRDGGYAHVVSADRAIVAQVEVSDEMMPGVVSLPHGWGHSLSGTRMRVASARPGANLNVVMDDRDRDPLSGNAVLSGVPVEIRPAAESDVGAA